MIDPRLELAVLNNVFWYRAMFRAHGMQSTADDLAWRSNAAPPPFYSNLVVLSPLAERVHLDDRLDSLERRSRPNGFSMKDSYATLDMSSRGYAVFFEAKWIWLEPSRSISVAPVEGWGAITAQEQLAAWEHVWWNDAANAAREPRARQFPPSLLDSPGHRFLVKYEDGKVVAGAIANRSPGVVGLSNTFSVRAAPFDEWSAVIACIKHYFGDVPVVGYQRGAVLERAQAAGFAPLGKLRVWSHV